MFSPQRAAMNRWSYENRNFQNINGQQSQKENDARFKALADDFDQARTDLGDRGKSLADLEGVAFPAMSQPHVPQMLGLPNQWLAWHGDILAKVSSKHKLGIPGDELNQLIRSSVLVFKNSNGEFELITEKRVGQGHLMVALKPDQEERFGLKPEQKLKMTFVKSAYGLTWDDMKSQDGKPVVGLEGRLKGIGGRTLVYADHVKLRSLLDESSANSDSSNPLRTNYRAAQVESGLTDKTIKGWPDVVKFVDTRYKGAEENKPVFSNTRESLREKADQIKAMPEDVRDDTDFYEFGYSAYKLYEAEKMMPKNAAVTFFRTVG